MLGDLKRHKTYILGFKRLRQLKRFLNCKSKTVIFYLLYRSLRNWSVLSYRSKLQKKANNSRVFSRILTTRYTRLFNITGGFASLTNSLVKSRHTSTADWISGRRRRRRKKKERLCLSVQETQKNRKLLLFLVAMTSSARLISLINRPPKWCNTQSSSPSCCT